MSLDLLAALSAGLLSAATATALTWLWWTAHRDPGPVTPDWDAGELPTLPPPRWMALRGEPCQLCGGRHCAGCDAPAQVMSSARRHQPRHDFAEVPPSVVGLAELMPVGLRATIIARELAGHWVWRPVDGTAFRMWAGRKLGRPLQLGLVTPGRLP